MKGAHNATESLATARAHAAAGGRVIGYVSDAIPVELILAAGALPLRLSAQPDAPTPMADRLLESSFVPMVRHIAEQWLTGELDFLEAVIFPRNNDSAQRLYYYLCELQRNGSAGGPKPLIFDLALIERETSRRHLRDSTRLLASQLGTDLDKLPAAASRVARRRTRLAEIAATLQTDEPPAGSAVRHCRHAAAQLWGDAADAAFGQSVAQLPRISAPCRIMLVGSQPPDDRLHVAVEQAGGSVVWDLTSPALDIDDSPHEHPRSIDGIADSCGERARRTNRATRGAELVRYAQTFRISGAVIWLIEEDEGMVWRLPEQVTALRTAGIEVMQLTRQSWHVDTPTLRQIHDFVARLGAPQ